MTDLLKELMALCKCSVSVTVNDHRDVYEKAEEYLRDSMRIEDMDEEIVEKMIMTDTIICVQAYPDTPIGFYVYYHYDLDTALTEVINAIKRDRSKERV